MLGFEIRDILLIVMVVLIGGKPVLNILSLIPGFAPLAKILEKLTVNGNGKNGNGAENGKEKSIEKMFSEFLLKLDTNHLHDVAKQSTLGAVNGKLDVAAKGQERIIDELKEIKGVLNDIKDKPC